MNNLGEVALAQGRPEEAEKHFRSALEIFERTGDKAHVPTAMNNLALVKKQLGQVTSAIELINRPLDTPAKPWDMSWKPQPPRITWEPPMKVWDYLTMPYIIFRHA